MKVNLNAIWTLEATPEDMRLIIAALRGALKPTQVEAAKELADALTMDRASSSRHLAREMEKHERDLKMELGVPGVPVPDLGD